MQLQLHLSAISTHESLGTRLQSLLPLISLHFLLLIGFFFSANYMMIAVPSEILLCLSDPLYTHTPLAFAWLKNIFFRMYFLVKYTLSHNNLYTYCLPGTFPTLAFSAFEHNGSHTSQESLTFSNFLQLTIYS